MEVVREDVQVVCVIKENVEGKEKMQTAKGVKLKEEGEDRSL